ncbi:MAG: Hsp33 family molecular chaperone HslO [Mariprofundaceae bacterium]
MATEKHDELIRFLLPKAHTRGVIIRTSHIQREAQRIHGLTGAPALLFSKALTSSILLLNISKGGVRQVLQLNSRKNDKPINKIIVETKSGTVRGYLNWNENSSHTNSDQNDASIGKWMGSDLLLSTVRDLGVGEPYTSTIHHDSDYLADHLVHYLNQSVQTRSDLILYHDMGLLIEAMPGCDEEHWFSAIESMATISNHSLQNETMENILQVFESLNCKIIGRDAYHYYCGCTDEKLKSALASIPKSQLKELADKNNKITLSCQYCDHRIEMPVE